MKPRFTRSSRAAQYLVATVLVLVPLHAFLTIWAATLVGHYTVLRLWDDAVLLVLMGISCFWVSQDAKLRSWLTASLLFRVIAAYAGLTLLLGAIAYVKGDVTPKALAYGVLVNLRFFAWFVAVVLVGRQTAFLRQQWLRLVVLPSGLVVVFAALQYTLLPHDFLVHFGYHASSTIAPIETINHNAHYIRVQSTLRGANPLGAYLVIIVSILGTLLLRGRHRLLCTVLGIVTLFALYASGSRSAWIGAALSLSVLGWLQLKSHRARLIFAGSGIVGITLLVGVFMLLRHNVGLQNTLLHTQTRSTVATSSNEAHASALKVGLKDVLQQPFGDGPGTAGPASVYNGSRAPRIAEDYYVQIAQETGWLGLALFLTIIILVAVELYARIGQSRLALIMVASLIGLSLVNLLSHAWVDDSLAYLWWGLAGIALSKPQKGKRAPQA